MTLEARILISIGCDFYDHQSQLEGAVRDARRIFQALIDNKVGEYDRDQSTFLSSPTLNEVRNIFRNKILLAQRIDTLTFFFAGHGGVKAGKFYICLKDTDSDLMSSTGFSMSELFQIIAELAPRHTNIILDACESGGLIQDIRSILDPKFMGDAGTPGLTIFATSAQDQNSGETDAGGFGTVALMECIEGKHYIQDTLPALDLVEIGRFVSDMIATETSQVPVVWGLNLNGPSGFCHNPFFSGSHEVSLKILRNNLKLSGSQISENTFSQLWQSYENINNHLDPIALTAVLVKIFSDLQDDVDILESVIRRVYASLVGRSGESRDAFRVVEVEAVICTALIAVSHSPSAAKFIEEILSSLAKKISTACGTVIEALGKSEYAILSRSAGLADLFYLPIRLTKILGWAACVVILARDTETRDEAKLNLKVLADFFIEKYTNSITAMSDIQAPFLAIAISQLVACGFDDQAEMIVSLMFSTFCHYSGKVARCDIDAENVLKYLIMRQRGEFDVGSGIIAQPDVLLTVLLKLSVMVGLEDTFNLALSKLDGHSFTAYQNGDFTQYANFHMRGGSNSIWQVGFDVFRVADVGVVSSLVSLEWQGPIDALLLSSLVLPNRVCWHLLEPQNK